ncbi:MAG TPA: ATP-binding protein [Longimicrobiales bacterium]
MTFRARLLLGCVALALVPLALFGLRARREVVERLEAQYRERVAALADVIQAELARESAAVGARLDRVAEATVADNRLRRALLDGGLADRAYLLDYAGHAMQLVGLDVLRIQDAEGRVLSSGHFRNEYDVVDAALPAALTRGGQVLAPVRTASGPVTALVQARELWLGGRAFTLVGGTAVDAAFLDRLARGTGLGVRLEAPGLLAASWPAPASASESGGDDVAPKRRATVAARGEAATGEGAARGAVPADYAREVPVRFAGAGPDTVARFVVHASLAPLEALRRDMERWLLAASIAAAGLALLLALFVSARLSRPLAELARRAARVDLERGEAPFATRRRDEIGALSRVLDEMVRRLRANAARLREAERRATIGEIARQVNHDIRNGLVPIRNVVSHLAELAREQPGELPRVFLERQRTLDASIEYLHALAANYARLSPQLERRPCDLNAIARAVASDAAGAGAAVRAAGAGEARATGEGAVRATGTVRVVGGGEARLASAGDVRGAGAGAARVAGATAGRVPGAGEAAGDGGVQEGAVIVTDLAPGLPPVHADPVALRRILENLVVNALESLEGGAGRVFIATRVERGEDGARVVLEVADTGRGMDEAQRARIFEHFYTTKPQGTGLGLSIVRRLVSDLGGRIEVESAVGQGTRFRVELPAA